MVRKALVSVALVAWSLMTEPTQAAARPDTGMAAAGTRIELILRYDSQVDAKRSRMVLLHPNGEASALPPAPGDAPEMLRTVAEHLAPGTYHLHWEVLASDGSVSDGDLPFTVTES